MRPPAGFEWVRDARTTMLVRADVRAWLEPALRELVCGGETTAGNVLGGGRGATRLVYADGRAVVVRAGRRGGLPARMLRELYFGCRPRPFRELQATERLRHAGAPVVAIYAAVVQWALPGCYRGWVITPYIAGSRTLWEWAREPHEPAARTGVLHAVGWAVRRLHACGGRHPDLNLNNILVAPGNGPPTVWLIDFDRATGGRWRGRNQAADLARLRRSARKLDPGGTVVTDADLDVLCAAYQRDDRAG